MIPYYKSHTPFPIIYHVAVKRFICFTLPSYHIISQFKRERIPAVIKSVLILIGSRKFGQYICRYIRIYVHVFMVTECYMACGKSVYYCVRCYYANHPIVCSSMAISYGGIFFIITMS
nr:MAG TPA: hypothetical protein [Bacteriophage sp.]